MLLAVINGNINKNASFDPPRSRLPPATMDGHHLGLGDDRGL